MGTICFKPNKRDITLTPSRSNVSDIRLSNLIDWDVEASGRIENTYKAIKCIGRGAFGQVFLVKKAAKERDSFAGPCSETSYFAMKIIRKDLMRNKKHITHLNTEQEILRTVKHPFIINLHHSFRSKRKVFLVMEFANGGSLKYHFNK